MKNNKNEIVMFLAHTHNSLFRQNNDKKMGHDIDVESKGRGDDDTPPKTNNNQNKQDTLSINIRSILKVTSIIQ